MSSHNFVLFALFALLACSSDAAAESPPTESAPAAEVAAEVASDADAVAVDAAAGDGVTLSITMTSFRSADGQVLVALFRGGDGFPSKPGNAYKTAITKISGSTASVEFAGLPAGEYAFSVLHDENGNNELDTNFLGIPKEGLGTSNNAKARMGPPKYKDAKFTVGDAAVSQRVKVVYF
jgi:uncharacterized protein (DUF2141 family)